MLSALWRVGISFRELQEKGFIKPQQKGSFSWKAALDGSLRATRWTLTELPQDLPEKHLTPTKDFAAWQPEKYAA